MQAQGPDNGRMGTTTYIVMGLYRDYIGAMAG